MTLKVVHKVHEFLGQIPALDCARHFDLEIEAIRYVVKTYEEADRVIYDLSWTSYLQ